MTLLLPTGWVTEVGDSMQFWKHGLCCGLTMNIYFPAFMELGHISGTKCLIRSRREKRKWEKSTSHVRKIRDKKQLESEEESIPLDNNIIIMIFMVNHYTWSSISWNNWIRRNNKKVIVESIGKVVTVPAYLSHSGTIFKRNLKRREGTSVFYLRAPMHVLMHFLQRYSVRFQL